MNQSPAAPRREASVPAARPSDQKAYEALERLLLAIRAGRVTGEAYLRLYVNQGGVTKTRASIEEDCH